MNRRFSLTAAVMKKVETSQIFCITIKVHQNMYGFICYTIFEEHDRNIQKIHREKSYFVSFRWAAQSKVLTKQDVICVSYFSLLCWIWFHKPFDDGQSNHFIQNN